MSFPDGFTWGATMSARAAWGVASGSDVAAGTSGPTASLGWPASAPLDAEQLAGLGTEAVRLTIDWALIEPEPGRIDEGATERVREAAVALQHAGLDVWGCLHDGPLPGWFSVDEHGFGDERARRYFWPRFVETAGEAFGDLVAGWVPVAEPNRWAMRGWIDGTRPPFRRDDAEGFAEALEGALLATVDAALRLRGSGRPVASAHWYLPVAPARLDADAPPTPEAEVWAARIDEIHRGCWERLLREGTLVVPNRPPVDVPGAREAFDLVGFSYRHAMAVRGDGVLLPYPQRTATDADGSVVWPEGFGVVLHRLAESFPDRPLVAEVPAMGRGAQASESLREVLAIADDAVSGGMDLRGLWWSNPIEVGPDRGTGLLDADRGATAAGDLWCSVAAGGDVPR